ncbi:MAG: hypothetical protein VW475_11340 [Curvibacter sp.]
MRFIVTAQAGPEGAAADPAPDFNEELFMASMRFNEEMHAAGVRVASEGRNPAAPGWRASVWQARPAEGAAR